MTDRRVARERLGVVDATRAGPSDERALHAAVLVAERDLEMQHGLAVALEPEVAGLDHAGVHRADRDFVSLAAGDREEVRDADRRCGLRAPSPRRLESHGLEPRMADRWHPPLLRDLALEQVNLGDHRSERRKSRHVDDGSRELDEPTFVVGKHEDQRDALAFRIAEQRRDASATLSGAADDVLKHAELELGHGFERTRRAVGHDE